MNMLDQERIIKLLSTLEGKDKLLRTAAYISKIISPRLSPETAKKIASVAGEFSLARTVLRRLGLLPMFSNTAKLIASGPGSDPIDHKLGLATALSYCVYFPAEDIAYYSRHGLLPFNAAWWALLSVLAWLSALFFSILRSARQLLILRVKQRKILIRSDDSRQADLKALRSDRLETSFKLVSDVADLCMGISFLPPGFFLWSSKLPQWKVGALGTISSLIGLRKLY